MEREQHGCSCGQEQKERTEICPYAICCSNLNIHTAAWKRKSTILIFISHGNGLIGRVSSTEHLCACKRTDCSGTALASTCALARVCYAATRREGGASWVKSRLKAILMLEWDEHPDNRATSLVNKRWAHEPQGGGSVYFGAKVWMIFLSALHACVCACTVTLTHMEKCFQSHSLPFTALCRRVTVEDRTRLLHTCPRGATRKHSQTLADSPGGVCQLREAMCQSRVMTTTAEVYPSTAETL